MGGGGGFRGGGDLNHSSNLNLTENADLFYNLYDKTQRKQESCNQCPVLYDQKM